MRIAFFHNLSAGGGKRAAFEIIKNLATFHQIDLFTSDRGAEDFQDITPMVNNYYFVDDCMALSNKGIIRFYSFYKAWSAAHKIAMLINDGGYDLCLIMQCKIINSPFLLRYLKIPSLYFCHEPYNKIMEPHYRGPKQDGKLRFFKYVIMRWFASIDCVNAKAATLICTSSLYSRENIYRNYGIYPRVNYLGVDSNFFHPLNLKRDNAVLCVGALNPAKGQDFVIRSVGTIEILYRPEVKFIYTIAYGSADYKKYLELLALRMGVLVSFECLVEDNRLLHAYNKSRLTVFPSLLEPLGLVPLESMACGTPVVGIAEAGIRETVIHQENGLLTEREPTEFGAAILKLLKDNVLWSLMSSTGRDSVVKNWSWEKTASEINKNIIRSIDKFKTDGRLEIYNNNHIEL